MNGTNDNFIFSGNRLAANAVEIPDFTRRQKIAFLLLGPPAFIIFCLYLCICFPIFVVTTLSSLTITFTRVSYFLLRRRLYGDIP